MMLARQRESVTIWPRGPYVIASPFPRSVMKVFGPLLSSRVAGSARSTRDGARRSCLRATIEMSPDILIELGCNRSRHREDTEVKPGQIPAVRWRRAVEQCGPDEGLLVGR